jgi:hypothetical protein
MKKGECTDAGRKLFYEEQGLAFKATAVGIVYNTFLFA